jgi:hypothetical protein
MDLILILFLGVLLIKLVIVTDKGHIRDVV